MKQSTLTVKKGYKSASLNFLKHFFLTFRVIKVFDAKLWINWQKSKFFFLLSFCICVSLLQGRYLHGVTYSRHSACMVLPGGLGFFKRWSTTPCIYYRTIDGVGTLLFIMIFIERIHLIWLKYSKLCSGERLI